MADTSSVFPRLCYKFAGDKMQGKDRSKEFEADKEEYLKNILPDKLAPFEKYLNDSKRKFLGGNSVCVADFQFWQFLDQNLNWKIKT